MNLPSTSPNVIKLTAASIAVLVGLIVILAYTSAIARADVTIAEDDFEGHAGGSTGHGWLDDWTFVGDAGYSDSNGPHAGASHLKLAGSGASAVRSVDITGESSLRLQMWIKVDEFDDGGARVEVSNDGSAYTTLQSWDDDDDDSLYTFFDFDLSTIGITFTNQLWFRARTLSGDDDDDDEDEEDEGRLFIDNLTLINSSDDPDPIPSTSIPVVIDSQFNDWTDKANLADAFDDHSGSDRRDIAAFYWANNIDEEINFHMLERHTTDGQPYDGSNGQTGPVRYMVHVDTNNNGDFFEGDDRVIVVTYVPTSNSSLVNVKVYHGNSLIKISDSGWNDWGDSRNEGGLRVEFALDWTDLGIQFGGVIRMYAVSFGGLAIFPFIADRVPDGTADIQWSPASVLGPWLLGAASVAGIAIIWFISRRRRLWT